VPDLIDEVLAAPVGVSLLEALEASCRTDVRWFEVIETSDPDAVDRAADFVTSMSFGELVRDMVAGAERIGGPWIANAPRRLVRAYMLAPARAPIAAAVAARLAPTLRSDLDRGPQQWWNTAVVLDDDRPVLASGRRSVYCCGEFTWNSLWTVTEPAPEVHDDLVDVWELFPGPVSRWRIPIEPTARIYEVHTAQDWARLVVRYPRLTGRAHGGWELPGPNQDLLEAQQLQLVSAGAAARVGVRVAMPDWERVADDFDGVHVSWSGKLTCEGRVIDVAELGDDVVTMLRYWGSERTLWLNDVFGVPEPLDAPELSGRINGDLGINADDADRRAHDTRTLAALVGRDLFSR
jgi:hypothetical protein